MKTRLAVLLVVTLLAGCDRQSTPDSGAGAAYKADLGRAIQAADEVVVTEHSSRFDLPPADGAVPKELPERIYRRVVLTADQRKRLLDKVEDMNPRTQEAFAACVFEPHHRIELSSAGKSIGSVEICFKCGDVQWAGTKSLPPGALVGMLEDFISGIGLQPTQDWGKLAKESEK